MEGFPVELIGNILSHVINVKDVVRVSMTCRKWRLAIRYLHTLQQDYLDAPLSNRTQQLEFLLTDTILQTWSLQNLHICHETRFSATAVIAWLSHAGDSLRHLTYEVPTTTLYVNMLERCGRMWHLESLRLRYTDIRLTTAHPTAPRFRFLLSLSLSDMVNLTALQLQSLVSACRKLESLFLTNSAVTSTDPHWTLNLTTSSLKSLDLDNMSLDSVILEAKLLETLCLRDSNFSNFKLVKKGAGLSSLEIDYVNINKLNTGSNSDSLDLEEDELTASSNDVRVAGVDSILSKPSLKLRKLQLRGIPLDADPVNLNLETIACLFPRLNHLGLSYRKMDDDPIHQTTVEHQMLQGSTVLDRVRLLELECHEIDDTFLLVIAGALKRCPNLRRVLVTSDEDSEFTCHFMTAFVKLVRQFSHIDIEFRRARTFYVV